MVKAALCLHCLSAYPRLPGHAHILTDGGKCRHLSATQKFVSLSRATGFANRIINEPPSGVKSVYKNSVWLFSALISFK